MADEISRERRRLTSEDRRAAILQAAISFFSRVGTRGSTRDLAAEMGISVGLVHRYFSKEQLIEEVYQVVFASRVDTRWFVLLADRQIPLRTRLMQFYQAYLAAVDDPVWARIAMQSALDGSMLGRKYLDEHVSKIINVIALELRAEGRQGDVTYRERERVWVLHSAIIYYLTRKHIHGMEGDSGIVIEEAVDVFLNGVLDR
jgi:AcrR family transcriptional regulator